MDDLLIKFLVTRLVRIRKGRVGAVTEGELKCIKYFNTAE